MKKRSFEEKSKSAKKAVRKRRLNVISRRLFHKIYDKLTSSRKNKVRILYKKQKKETKTPKGSSQKKNNKIRIEIIDGKHIRIEKCPKCGKLVKATELKKHISYHKRARTASQRNIQSELQYVKKLKKQNLNSLLFQTGKEIGVPDIVLYKNHKLSFYEVKPTKQENEKNSRLKKTQVAWIKKNCFVKGIEAYVVFANLTRARKHRDILVWSRLCPVVETCQSIDSIPAD